MVAKVVSFGFSISAFFEWNFVRNILRIRSFYLVGNELELRGENSALTVFIYLYSIVALGRNDTSNVHSSKK